MAGNGTYVDVHEKNFMVSTPFTIVKGQFANAQEFAESARLRTNAYLDALQDTLSSLQVPDTGGLENVVAPDITDISIVARPELSELDLNTDIPAASVVKPSLLALPDIPILDIPNYTFSIPTWSEVEKPTLNTVEAPGSTPALSTVSLPDAPDITLPEVPNLQTISIPGAPSVYIEDFDTLAPTLANLSLPQELAFTPEAYSSDIWPTLMSKILKNLQDGGTGLPEDVELGIWERAKTRALEDYTSSLRDIEAKFGQNGLGLPSGAYTSALLALEADWARKIADLGYTISEEQAKLAQTNSHFILEQGLKCEELIRNFFNSQQDRILDAAYKAVQTNIEVYKAAITEHNAKVLQFQAEVTAYETKIKTIQARLDAYKTSIEGLKVSADVQALLVDVYSKQVSAAETKVRLYAVQLEAANTTLTMNGQKLSAYKTAIEAYSAGLAAEKIKYEIYAQELAGEQSKADVYKSQVQAYEALVNAASKKQEAYSDRSEAITKQNEALISAYRADLQAYEVEVNAVLKALEAKVAGYQAETAAYSAETSGLTAYYSAKEAQIRVLVENASFALNKAVATIKAVSDSYVSLNTLKVEGYKGIANVGAQLTAAALSGIHASSSVGYSAGESMSESWNHGDSISETHSFDETPAP